MLSKTFDENLNDLSQRATSFIGAGSPSCLVSVKGGGGWWVVVSAQALWPIPNRREKLCRTSLASWHLSFLVTPGFLLIWEAQVLKVDAWP